jgi:hypothetical protein
MTNLLQKLKPEIQDLINKDLLEYPHSTQILINELSSTYYINDLKYFCILDIERYFLKLYKELPSTPWDCLVENYEKL